MVSRLFRAFEVSHKNVSDSYFISKKLVQYQMFALEISQNKVFPCYNCQRVLSITISPSKRPDVNYARVSSLIY
jgi:hypothetical protein